MFCLKGKKVRSQVPYSFPVRSGLGNKATASVCGRKLFTRDSFRFSGTEHWLQMTKKTVPKRTRWMPFIALKNNPVFIIVQSCCSVFPKEPALGSADQQITRLPRSLLNKSPTCTKFLHLERYQILEPHNVFRSGISNLWVFLLCVRNTWNIPTKKKPCDKGTTTCYLSMRASKQSSATWQHCKKHLIFQRERCWGSGFVPPIFSTNFIISK